ncbi:MAG: ABC transporter permease [Desulfobacterales bacterium]|nr:ABC transporter permease [Desulfobacterales bacterium]MCP4158945.1 ABC transporter permease [Deltaproteobacteria bacterium]
MVNLEYFSFIIDYLPIFFEGAIVTINVAVCSLVFAVSLGILGALAKLSKSRILNYIAQIYTTVIRGIPDLVLMLLIYFGGQKLVNLMTTAMDIGYVDINPFIAGFLTIGFIFGAYMAETFRGAFLAVDKGQLEAGFAYGMSKAQVFFKIMFPQMARHALPGLGNNWLVLVKSTALVSIIGLDDMVRKANIAGGSTQKPFAFYFLVAIVFLVLTSISIFILGKLERKYSIGVRKV